MVHDKKNYETVSTFVKVVQKKPWPLFSDTVYIHFICPQHDSDIFKKTVEQDS